MLQELLRNVEDVTGKEDLVTYLRMQVLQKVHRARANNFVISLGWYGVCLRRHQLFC